MQGYLSSLCYDNKIHDTSCQLMYNNDGDNDEYIYVFYVTSSTIIMMTTTFHELSSVIYNGKPFAVNNEISSDTSADK